MLKVLQDKRKMYEFSDRACLETVKHGTGFLSVQYLKANLF